MGTGCSFLESKFFRCKDQTADYRLTTKLTMLRITSTAPFVVAHAHTLVHSICYHFLSSCFVIYGKNGKVIMLQARCDPEGG